MAGSVNTVNALIIYILFFLRCQHSERDSYLLNGNLFNYCASFVLIQLFYPLRPSQSPVSALLFTDALPPSLCFYLTRVPTCRVTWHWRVLFCHLLFVPYYFKVYSPEDWIGTFWKASVSSICNLEYLFYFILFIISIFLSLPKDIFSLLLEREEKVEEGRERNIDAREALIVCLLYVPRLGLYVPGPGIEPTT